MSTTLIGYLTEYKEFDDMNVFLESMQKEVRRTYVSYENDVRKANQKFFLEGVDEEPFLEAAENNFFARIGRKIRELAEKIKNFFGNILAKIKGEDINSEQAKAQQVLKEHPEYKDKILISLEKGDITLHDVAQYEKDVETLIELIKKNQIDENSFKERVKKAGEKFIKTGKVVADVTGTAVAIVMIAPKIMNACSDAKKSMERLTKWCDKLKVDLEKNSLNDPSKVSAIMNTIGGAIGLQTTEYKNRISLLHRISLALKKLGRNKLGDKFDEWGDKQIEKDKKKLEENRKKYDEQQQMLNKYKTKKDDVTTFQGFREQEVEKKEKEEKQKEKEKNTTYVQHNMDMPDDVKKALNKLGDPSKFGGKNGKGNNNRNSNNRNGGNKGKSNNGKGGK